MIPSVMSWTLDEHERGLAASVAVNRRARFIASLGSSRARAKLRQRLAHFPDLDPRLLVAAMHADEQRVWVLNALRADAAPHSCWVVCEDPNWDGRLVPLDEAIDNVLGRGYGSLLSCIPGRLGLFEGESVRDRSILRRAS